MGFIMKKSLLLIVSFIFSQVIVGQTSRTYTQADYEKACVFDYDSSYDTRLFKYFMVDNYFEYRDFYKFYDGLACVKMNDLWGFVDTKGKEIIPIKYTRVLPFSDGLAAVSLNYIAVR